MNFSKKTYYGVGVVAAALGVAGALLYLPGIYASALFTASSVMTGATLLLLAYAERPSSSRGRFYFAALLLQLIYFFPGVPMKVCGALVWPVFALPHWRQTGPEDPVHTMAYLTMLAGAVQLVFSFVPLPALYKGVMAVVISVIQLVLMALLFRGESARQKGGEE